ncbi:hypothetical protein CHRY9293_01620 [Chryseobacterium potabilaquae]|uniref:Uncharacterized protein n=2 Tax=Chryseobacterium TaxID=59732 RepID=A0A6N4XAH3_9FLAO|nr:hypothetical protein D1632_15590 [Chryseobacterium nematophagum]CAA7195421.1 hypothetical protein CHRY9293_01620 [Chryseobacterium potabilaquae]
MSSEIDYKIATDYLNKLPENIKIELCNRTLGQVNDKKQPKRKIRKFCSEHINILIKNGKL